MQQAPTAREAPVRGAEPEMDPEPRPTPAQYDSEDDSTCDDPGGPAGEQSIHAPTGDEHMQFFDAEEGFEYGSSAAPEPHPELLPEDASGEFVASLEAVTGAAETTTSYGFGDEMD